MRSLVPFPDRLGARPQPAPRRVPGALRVKAVLASWAFLVREGVVGFRRNGLMSAAASSSILVALVAFGGALVTLWNLQAVAARVEEQLVVVAYLHDALSPAEVELARKAAAALPGAREVVFVPREEALRRLEQALGGVELGEVVRRNPLPHTLEVRPRTGQDLLALARALRGVPGVVEVADGQDATGRVLALTRLVRAAGAAVTLSLAAVATVVSTNALRLTVLARRRELEIMRLVGATEWFVRWPFLVEGTVQGLVAATGAAAFWVAFYAWSAGKLQEAWPFLPLVVPGQVAVPLAASLFGAGVCVGLLGAALSLGRCARP